MQIKNIGLFILLLISFYCSNARSDIYVYFINGASNSSKEGREASAKNLVRLLKEGNLISKNKIIYGAIPIVGGYTDAYEIKFQQKMSSKSMSNTFDDLSIALNANIYLKDLGASYQAQYDSPFPIYGVDNNVVSNTAAKTVVSISHDISEIIYDKILNNNKVILISHSQGNLYVEGALAFLYHNYNYDVVRSNLKVVNLASNSALSYNGSWITLSQDQAVNGKKYGVLVDDGVFKVTQKNEDACLLPCNKIASLEDLRVGVRVDAHGFNEIYINNEIFSYGKKKSIPSLILKYVQDAINILELPEIFSVSPAQTDILDDVVYTVTGKNLPSGMGFAVNDCDPSSLELSGGTSSKRQFRCTTGGVPGEKNGVIKDRPGGKTLFEFKVIVKAPSANTWVTRIEASSLTLKQFFYRDLGSLPNGLSIFSGEYRLSDSNDCILKQPLEIHAFRNNQEFEITTITVTERDVCPSGAAHTAVKGYTETYNGRLQYGFIFLQPKSACSALINNVCYNFETVEPEQ